MRGSRRLAALVAALLAIAVPAAAVAAGFTSGNYSGKTKQGKKITFKADSSTSEVFNLKFSERGKCNNGDLSKGSQGPLSADVSSSGKFHFSGNSKSGGTKVTVNGKIAGRKASGNFNVTSRFNNAGQIDPNGSIKCTTGKIKWSAKKK